MVDLIEKKKRGEILSYKEIGGIVSGYTKGQIPDYQMSAFLMACCFMPLTEQETLAMTMAMAASGSMLDLSSFGSITADKHSTGGVGDKISLILIPIMASLGVKMVKLSGRGLGHTGGTIDKLEAINGFRTDYNEAEIMEILKKTDAVLAAQSAEIAPADKKIYALRDVTATVDNIPLIAASVMSKKIASGAGVIVLDIKCGSGAFAKDLASAERLAKLMVKIGTGAGRKVTAVITDMSYPLGMSVGNSIEVMEATLALKGKVPKDIDAVVKALGAQILILAGKAAGQKQAYTLIEDAVMSGIAYAKFIEMLAAQQGDIRQIEYMHFPISSCTQDIVAKKEGYIGRCDCELVGKASVATGAGRARKEDKIDLGAGILFYKAYGDRVRAGETIAAVYAAEEARVKAGVNLLNKALGIVDTPPEKRVMVKGIIR